MLRSRQRSGVWLWLGVLLAPLAARGETDYGPQVQALAQPLIDNGGLVGCSVGLLTADGVQFFNFGSTSSEHDEAPSEHTLYEIGSITKTFTGLLLADASLRGEVALETPLAELLPQGVAAPQFEQQPILLKHLANHTSGLPRMAGNFAPADPQNPFADYTAERLWEFLPTCELKRQPDAQYEYSNLAFGILGELLRQRAQAETYEVLLRARVLDALAMEETAIHLSDEQRARFAQGHDAALRPALAWDLAVHDGAGAIRSTATDMLKYAAFALHPSDDELGAAERLAQEPTTELPGGGLRVCLGWHLAADGTLSHGGQTGGYHAYLAVHPAQGLAVVVLSNTATGLVDQLGSKCLQVLRGETPEPVEHRESVPVAAEILQRYVGRYAAQGAVFLVALDGEQLMVQLTGQESLPVFAASEAKFFYRIVPAEIDFAVDADGNCTGLVLHQNGVDLQAQRLPERIPVEVAADTLAQYVGKYQLLPGAQFTIAQTEEGLTAQVTGQPAMEIVPESETEFYYPLVDAAITFERDENGEVQALVLHQNGLDLKAPRLK